MNECDPQDRQHDTSFPAWVLRRSSSMTVAELNQMIVLLRPTVKKAIAHTMSQLTRKIQQLRKKRKAVGSKDVIAGKVERLSEEILQLKKLPVDQVAKIALGSTLKLAELSRQTSSRLRAEVRVCNSCGLSSQVAKWRSEHEDWRELAEFMRIKNSGRRLKPISNRKHRGDLRPRAKALLEIAKDVGEIQDLRFAAAGKSSTSTSFSHAGPPRKKNNFVGSSDGSMVLVANLELDSSSNVAGDEEKDDHCRSDSDQGRRGEVVGAESPGGSAVAENFFVKPKANDGQILKKVTGLGVIERLKMSEQTGDELQVAVSGRECGMEDVESRPREEPQVCQQNSFFIGLKQPRRSSFSKPASTDDPAVDSTECFAPENVHAGKSRKGKGKKPCHPRGPKIPKEVQDWKVAAETKATATGESGARQCGSKALSSEAESSLHPSWEASRKRRQESKDIFTFAGTKTTFAN